MRQKLSAMNYIRNNKRRAAVLIVSLALYLVIVYLTQFILSSGTESFKKILVEDTKKMQLVQLPDSAFGITRDEMESEDAAKAAYTEAEALLMERLREQAGVKAVQKAQSMGVTIYALIGQYSFSFPLGDEAFVKVYMEHMGATLKEGELPDAPGEIILADGIMKNAGLTLGQKLSDKDFQIVGIAESDTYFGGGIMVPEKDYSRPICVLSDGSIKDMGALLRKMGYEFSDNEARIYDYKAGNADYEDVFAEVETPANLVFKGVMIVMAIMLLLVYTTVLRDRHGEWCLYCSIGYSRKAIYFSILREMLFYFVVAVVVGTVLTIIGMVAVDALLIAPMGLACKYLDVSVMGEIVRGYAVVFALLQLPIRFALHKIRTVDAMEEDLY
ncbi:MAG: FtsX-like permease family protein [Lachnospiraceae bacterium]|nr:FtsX-like permease family protein [Lachnospiraceae bacterium]